MIPITPVWNSKVAVFVAAIGCLIHASVWASDPQPINPNDPAQGRFSDEWAEIRMAGKKIGYAHSTMARKSDIIHSETTMTMRLGRADRPVEITVQQGSRETVSGRPVTFETTMHMATIKTATRGTIKNGKVTIVTSQYGMEQTRTFDFPQGALMTWGSFRESLLHGFQKGTTYTLHVYAPELRTDGAVPAVTTIGPWEQWGQGKSQQRGQRVTVVMDSPAGKMEIVSWVNEKGMPLKVSFPMPGLGNMELVTTDEAAALEDFVPPELFMTTTVAVRRPIDAKTARRITYRLYTPNSAVDIGSLPSTAMQSVTPLPDGSQRVILTRQSHKRIHTLVAQTPLANRREYLDGNLMINTADPKLVKLAKEAAGGKTEPFALADRLRRFVTDYVTTKSLNVGFATASEVCRRREGDCSEHGILLAALGRLNGLPSRVAVGLAYVPAFGGKTNIFGYHLWTQFYIDGRWVDFDAALRESDCSPIRIAFATSSLKNTGLADLSLPLLSKIGSVSIDVLDVQLRRDTPSD